MCVIVHAPAARLCMDGPVNRKSGVAAVLQLWSARFGGSGGSTISRSLCALCGEDMALRFFSSDAPLPDRRFPRASARPRLGASARPRLGASRPR
eukprot:1695900-Prymnesium_polylepis.1